MTGRALSLVTVDTDLCTWCLGTKGAHHPHCYVGRALAARDAARPAPTSRELYAQAVSAQSTVGHEWAKLNHENNNAKTGL